MIADRTGRERSNPGARRLGIARIHNIGEIKPSLRVVNAFPLDADFHNYMISSNRPDSSPRFRRSQRSLRMQSAACPGVCGLLNFTPLE